MGLSSIISVLLGGKLRYLSMGLLAAVGGVAINQGESSQQLDSREAESGARYTETNYVDTASASGLRDGSFRNESGSFLPQGSWGDATTRLGGSFVVALILGTLFRAFLKTMVTAACVVGIIVWFLHSKGLMDPFWESYSLNAESIGQWVSAQTETVVSFLKGYLPSTGAGVAGFIAGVKK